MRRLVVLLLLASLAHAGDDRPARVAPAALQMRIDKAIDRAVGYLRRTQKQDGYWQFVNQAGPNDKISPYALNQRAGLTALALYALSASGVPSDDAAIRKGLSWMKANTHAYRKGPGPTNYAASFAILALTRIDAKAHKLLIHVLADAVVSGQRDNGMWGYGVGPGRTSAKHEQKLPPGVTSLPDNSNTQFSILALWAAYSIAGYEVPKSTWKRARKHYISTQEKNGGWKYRRTWHDTSPAMTAAGAVSLVYIQAAMQPAPQALKRARAHPAVQRALKTLPRLGAPAAKDTLFPFGFYWLYSAERVGTVLALKDNGWYVAGARFLVENQGKDGEWPAQHGPREEIIKEFEERITVDYETALGLLFLSRATYTPTRGEMPRERKSRSVPVTPKR